MVLRILTYGLLLLASHSLIAQDKIVCLYEDGKATYTEVSDSVQALKILRQWRSDQNKNGFLTAGIDSCTNSGDSLFAWTYLGPKYRVLTVSKHNLPASFFDSTQRSMDYTQWASFNTRLIDHYEDQGYPFVSTRLRKVSAVSDHIHAEIFFDKGPKIVYDSLDILGNSELSKKYLGRYLDILEGRLYRESDVKKIDNKLRNLPLVTVKGPTKVYFYQGLARIVLQIDDRVIDRLDGVVGLAPNSNKSSTNSLLITGEIHLELNNILKSANAASLHWRNYLERSQSLDFSFSLPYLFNTKLGLDAAFDLNKYDTLFLNLDATVGIKYQRQANNSLELYYQYTGSNLITVDTTVVRSNGVLPPNNPFRIDNYGIRFRERNFDYLPNPRRGYNFIIDGALGVKQLLRNTLIDRVQFTSAEYPNPISIYDTLDAQSLRARFQFHSTLILPIAKRSALVNSLTFNGIFADQILFNEYYNFGGFHSLQGFDERSLFASKYLSYRIEYRYLFSQNGNAGVFFNMAAMENPIQLDEPGPIDDLPIGFGVQAHLPVGSGVLRIAYALGSQQGNAIQFSAAKIHFGLVNYF